MFFFFNDTATTEIYTLSLHDALPISAAHGGDEAHAEERAAAARDHAGDGRRLPLRRRSEEHTSELQSLAYLVCRLLLEKKKQRLLAHCGHISMYSVRGRVALATR